MVTQQVSCDAYMVLVSMADTKLKGSKETGAPGDGSPHEMKLTKDALPGLEANTLLSPEVIKNGKDLGFAVVSQFEHALGRIEHPTKDFFALYPAAIPSQCFLF